MTDILYHLIPNAPKPVAPYSHVVECDGWLFVTGQLATDPVDDSLPIPDGIEAQTIKVMDNLKRALTGAGASFDRVVFARIYLTNFERDYPVFLTIDGRSPVPIEAGSVVTVRKAKQSLPLAALPGVSFFSVVRQKLKWRGSNV